VEIVIIALETVLGKPILNQIIVVTFIAFLATGRLWDCCTYCKNGRFRTRVKKRNSTIAQFTGDTNSSITKSHQNIILCRDDALLLVSGGIFVHNIEPLHHFQTA
jgi:predicted DNA repair protein MutK